MNWSVGTKIGSGFGLALVILIILGVITYGTTSELKETADLEAHSQAILKDLEDLGQDLSSLESAERGYIITGQEDYLEPYRAAVADSDQKTKDLRKLLA